MKWILEKCQGRAELRDSASPAVLWPCSCITLRCCLFTHTHNLQLSAHKGTTLGHPHGQFTLFRRSRAEELSAKTVDPVRKWNWTHVSVCSCVTNGKCLHSKEFTHGFESLHLREVVDVIFYIVLIAIENIYVLVPTYTLIQCPVEVSIQKLEKGTQRCCRFPKDIWLLWVTQNPCTEPFNLGKPTLAANHEKPWSFCRREWMSFPLVTVANLWGQAFWRGYLSGATHPESPINHLFPSVIKAITAFELDSLRQQSWLVKANVTL